MVSWGLGFVTVDWTGKSQISEKDSPIALSTTAIDQNVKLAL